MRDRSQSDAFDVHDLESFKIEPVVLSGFRLRQCRTRHPYFTANQRRCSIAVGNARQLGNHALALLATLATLQLPDAFRGLQLPRLVAEDLRARVRPRFQLDHSADAGQTDDATDQHLLFATVTHRDIVRARTRKPNPIRLPAAAWRLP